jgi:hypothetical protein
VFRTWLLLSAGLLAVVLALAGCQHPSAGAVPRPHPNPPPAAPATPAASPR